MTSRQKISKDIEELDNTISLLDLVDIYRPLHTTTSEYTLLSSTHGTFPTKDYTLHHKTNLSKF